MKKGDYITIKTFDGNTASGFYINHPSELPKAAKFDRYTYDEQFNSYAIYCNIGKNAIKYYIRKSL